MGKHGSVHKNTYHEYRSYRVRVVCLAVLMCFTGQNVLLANPMGGEVINGQASFAVSGNTLTVTNTPGAIINWQGFSINANEVTHFAQQSAASAVLNRVVTNNPSAILGTLSSNGQVYLVNPGGIVFGAGSTVNVAGLVATSLNLSDADFLAGRHNYTNQPGAQNISNAGNINAQQGGQIYLIAPNVENTGIITAPNGEILLAAGREVQLVNSLDPSLRVSITAPAGDATNLGRLIVESGSLGLFGTVVKNTGAASADSATMQGGKIVFKASNTTVLDASSVTTATGKTGGTVMVEGNSVALLGNASVDVSGANGGGTVLVGGDAHGANPNVQNSQATFVDSGVSIKADAVQNGNGGKVVVWADNTTQFGGYISARGGAQGGNGGWVETSGKQWLGFSGLVDTTAAHGMIGSLLLDPTDVTISTAAQTGTMLWNAGGLTFSDVATGGVNVSNLNVTNLVTQLGLTNVTVSSSGTGVNPGNIDVQTPIAWASANSLTLSAAGTGAITTTAGSTITNTGTGGLTMTTAAGGITLNAGVTLANGAFTATANGAASSIAINAPISTGTGAINLTAGASINEGAGGTLATVTDLATGTLGVVTTSSTTGTTLSGANSIAIYKATNTVSGNITLNNNAPTTPYAGLTLLTTTNTGGGSINVTNIGTLCICWNGVTPTVVTNNGGGAINLTATGASGWIREATGTIVTTGTLTTNSSQLGNSTTLNGGANMVGTFNATATGSVMLSNGTALNVTGINASDALITNTATTTFSGLVSVPNGLSVIVSGATSDILLNSQIASGNATATPSSVSLSAGRDIVLGSTGSISNGGGTATNAVNISFISDSAGGVNTGGIWTKAGSSLNSNGGVITMGGGAVGGYAVADVGSNNSGIYLDGTITTGTGNLTMLGDGGTLGDGVTFGLTSNVNSNGIVNITGKAASAGNLLNDLALFGSGVDFIGNGATGALLTTATGTVTINGTNTSAAAGGARSQGITVEAGAIVQTTGAGTLTFNGASNAVSANTAYGIGLAGGTIQSTAAGGGSISLNGTTTIGGGVIIDQLNFNAAPAVFYASHVLSNGGEILIKGAGAAAWDSVFIGNGSVIGGVSSGNILLQTTNANRIAIAANGSVNAGVNALTISTAGGLVTDLGASPAGGSISAGSLRLLSTGATASFSFTNPVNNIGTLAANVTGPVVYSDTNGVAIGSVTSFDGTAITTTNAITTGNSALTVNANQGATPGNIVMNAGSFINAGTASITLDAIGLTLGGNFINSSGSTTPITGASVHVASTNFASTMRNGMAPVASYFACTVGLAICVQSALANPTGVVFMYSDATAPTLTIVANTLSKVYGSTDPALGYTLSGLGGGDTAAIVTGAQTRVAGENAGTYAISQGTLSVPVGYGYTLLHIGSNLVISKAPLTVAAIPVSKVFGTPDPVLDYTVTGLQFSDTKASTLTGTIIRDPGEVIGSYAVNQGTLALLNSNYTLNYVPCKFTILASTVVQEITQISMQNTPQSDTATAMTEDEKKQAARAAAEAEVVADRGNANAKTESLPVCR